MNENQASAASDTATVATTSSSTNATPAAAVTVSDGIGSELSPDTNAQNANASPSIASANPISGNQAQNQQQSHIKPPVSPVQHQQQLQQNDSGSNVPALNHHAGPNVHHYVPQSGGTVGFQPRHHAQSYHNQQMQHYHPHHLHHPQPHQNKYNHHHHHHNQQHHPHHHHQRGDSESNPNHILLITVINPHYTITCDLIHQICSTYGKVNRIVIFKKNGVQAMVEFDNVESAKRAKTMLYGCDIYSGCCTLRIEYAKPTRLNIHKNDNDSYDYTTPNLDSGGGDGSGVQEAGVWNPNAESNQQASGVPSGQQHQSPHIPHHHMRGTRGQRGGHGGHNHHHGAQHYHPHHAQHQQAGPQSGAPHHHHHMLPAAQQAPPPYAMGSTTLDQQQQAEETATDAFHRDESFNVSRGGLVGGVVGGSAGASSISQPYVGVESPYVPSQGGPTHGGVPHNMYSRQDGHNHGQHHHPHHHHHHGGDHPRSSHHGPHSGHHPANSLMSGSANTGPTQGTVMMVYGLQPERVSCDRLFNLFCLYGNVVRVKFLRTKEGCAMVQMGDVLAVDRCVSSLNKITLFGSELQISYSKQPFLHDVIQPFILPDGSLSFKDFTANKNNRFKNPEVASKNRILPPSQVLHFFNAPYGITEDELVHLFKQSTGHDPLSVKIFTPKAEPIKSFSGLIIFKDSAEATEALVVCNHLNMPKPGVTHPYILRLCFSPPTSYVRHSLQQREQQQQQSPPQLLQQQQSVPLPP